MRSRISIRGYVGSSIRPFVGWFVHPSVRWSVRPSVRSLVGSSVRHTQVETMQQCRFWPKLLSVRAATHAVYPALFIHNLEPKLKRSKAVFLPQLSLLKKGRKLPLWEAISPVWKRNSIIASMAPFLSSWAIYRHLICPYYVIHVGCRGRGANDFAASSRFIKISLVKTFRLKWSVTNRRIDGRSPGGRSVPFVKVFCCTEILIYDNGTAFSILHKLDQSIELGAVSFRQT